MGDDPERRAIDCSRYCICARRPWRKVAHEGHGRLCPLRCDLLSDRRNSTESKPVTGRGGTNHRLSFCKPQKTRLWEVIEPRSYGLMSALPCTQHLKTFIP